MNNIKVYTIEITGSYRKGIWYEDKKGQKFSAILSAKDDGVFYSPVFAVVKIKNDELVVPIVHTVRPADCKIVKEQILKSQNDYHHIINSKK